MIPRSARSSHRPEGPDPRGKAPSQGLDVTQGPAFEAVGEAGFEAGDSSAGSQQHRVLQSIPHAHRCPAWSEGPSCPVAPIAPAGPAIRQAAIRAIVAIDGRDGPAW